MVTPLIATLIPRCTGGIENESITYTWSDLNVYAAKRDEKPWDSLLRRKKPVERRHLLKDGTIVIIYALINILIKIPD